MDGVWAYIRAAAFRSLWGRWWNPGHLDVREMYVAYVIPPLEHPMCGCSHPVHHTLGFQKHETAGWAETPELLIP